MEGIPVIIAEKWTYEAVKSCYGGVGRLYKRVKAELLDTGMIVPTINQRVMGEMFDNPTLKMRRYAKSPHGVAVLLGFENCLMDTVVELQTEMERRYEAAIKRANYASTQIANLQNTVEKWAELEKQN